MVSNRTNKSAKAILTGGYTLLCGILLIAYKSPAESYELSIYLQTPQLFWVVLILLITISVIVILYSPLKLLGVLLLQLSILTVIALPLIRGYFYYGAGDGLAHWGIVRNIASDTIGITDFLYPGLHTIIVVLEQVTGRPFRILLFLIVPFFVLCFSLFIGASSAYLLQDKEAVYLGMISGVLLIPINNISSHLMFHPSTLTILYSSFPIYILLRQNSSNGKRWTWLFVLVSLATVLFHPQQAMNVFLLSTIIVIILSIYKYSKGNISKSDKSILQIIIFLIIIVGWISIHTQTVASGLVILKHISQSITDVLLGQTKSEVAASSSLLSSIDASINELAMKIFFLNLVYSLLSIVAIQYARNQSQRESLEIYAIIFGNIPILLLFSGLAATDIGQALRYLAFGMVSISILGTIGLYTVVQLSRTSNSLVKIITSLAIVTLLIISLPILLHSPYIYLPTSHVTEQSHTGFQQAVDLTPKNENILGVRSTSKRHLDAVYGLERLSQNRSKNDLQPMSASELADQSNSTRYVAITESDQQRELQLYGGEEYTKSHITSFNSSIYSNEIYDNGGLSLYKTR